MTRDPAAELEALRAFLVDRARRLLRRHREFHPFAAAVAADGRVESWGDDGDDELPPAPGVAALLVAGLRERAAEGRIRAAGLCVAVRTSRAPGEDVVDAIAASMEHVRGDAVDWLLPYCRGLFRRIRWGAPFTRAGSTRFFTGGAGTT